MYLRSLSKYIRNAEHIITIDEEDQLRLEKISKTQNIVIAGNPRIDSIIDQLKELDNNKLIASFYNRQSKELSKIIWGSTHKEDEQIIIPLIKNLTASGYRMVIAPHESNRAKTLADRLKSRDIKTALYSTYQEAADIEIIIIDQIGILKSLYQNCNIAYVGGGFSGGLHNIAEPLLSNCHTITGPNINNSKLAQLLADHNTLSVIQNSKELESVILNYKLCELSILEKTNHIITKHKGAAPRVMDIISFNGS